MSPTTPATTPTAGGGPGPAPTRPVTRAEPVVELSRIDRVLNRTIGFLARRGVSVVGTRILAVRGRRSGEWRTVVVNPFAHDGERYLVAPRGTTAWVRNLRAAGHGELRLGRRVEAVTATEVADAAKAPILRGYLAKYGWEVGRFFSVDADASDEQLAAIAADHPVFRLAPT